MKTVVLLSGGMDSMLAAEIATEDTTLLGCLFVNYDQPALEQERMAARHWCKERAIRLTEYRVEFDCSALRGDGPNVVGGRNAILLSLGVNFAVNVDADQVWYGANADDGQEYPDCHPGFWQALNSVMFNAYRVRISSPLASRSKAWICQESDRRGLTDWSWSCYTPKFLRPCGKCYSCEQIQKASAFAKADPVLKRMSAREWEEYNVL
jgi:7-cyano-7-deazaguanine synthase